VRDALGTDGIAEVIGELDRVIAELHSLSR